jgi:hypothetical protein
MSNPYYNMRYVASTSSSASSRDTYATLIKRAIAKMPESLNTKKDVDQYYKNEMERVTPTEKKNETRLFIFIYLKTMF